MKAIHKSATALWLACGAVACATAEKGGVEPQPARAEVQSASGAVPIEQMRQAIPSSKPGAPVELLYAVTGELGQSRSLELALIPRVVGENLRAEFLPAEGLSIESGTAPLARLKADRGEAYRHVLKVRAESAGPTQMRVLVSMEVEGARFFTVFALPLAD